MDGSSLTEDQKKLFGKLRYEAFLEIRAVGSVGLSDQAAALADAFHNLPLYVFRADFRWEQARLHIGGYQRKYPRVVTNNCVTGSYNDYLAMLDEIERLNS